MKFRTSKINTAIKTCFLTSMLANATGIYADDTEVFYSANVSSPNLLFVLDVSGSMGTPLLVETTLITESVTKAIESNVDDAEQLSSGRGFDGRGSFLEMGDSFFNSRGSEHRVGLRFRNLDIPPGAIVTNAYIQFQENSTNATVNSPETLADAQLSIAVESENGSNNNPPAFSNGNSLTTRVISSTTVDWDPPVWDVRNEKGINQRTSDISELVQTVIEQDNWGNQNAIVFIIEGRNGNQGTRIANSSDGGAPAEIFVEYTIPGETVKTRLEVMQEALRTVLDEAPDNINIGLMNYGTVSSRNNNPEARRTYAVSGVSYPVRNINSRAREVVPSAAEQYGLPSVPSQTATVREYLADIADSWTPRGPTPIVDSIYEAALYLRGETVHYGQTLPTLTGSHPSTYTGPVVSTNVYNEPGRVRANAPDYISPIVSSCQSSYIALMSDGGPNYSAPSGQGRDFPGPLARKDLINVGGPQGPLADAINNCADAAGGFVDGKCGAELTRYIATNDNIPNRLDDDQFIDTFTIGFATGEGSRQEDYLQSLATYDGDNNANTHDGYFEAESPEELAAAFRDILDAVAEPAGTLASPGYSVNVRSGLENESDIFIPVFDRENGSRWSGNLKKFRLQNVGGSRVIQGSNNLNATDEDGNFTADALDFWSTSTTPDGAVVTDGGVAGLIDDPSNTGRKIYSNLTGDSNVNLNSTDNLLTTDNINTVDSDVSGSKINNQTLNLPDDADLALRTKLINFMRGYVGGDVNSGPRRYVGDMLHTEPVIITYDIGDGTAGSREQYVFAATNEGYLHAFDAETGEEKFAFIPKELLQLADPLYRNEGDESDHRYGIDGILNFQFKGGRDGQIDAGDKIFLYFGLRRGGTSYYGLDITDIDNPKLMWTKSADDHPSMGQSWSRPYLKKVGVSGSTCMDGQNDCKDVVIISGGYDGGIPEQGGGGDDGISEDRDLAGGNKELDDSTTDVRADRGNDILILDALNGDLIWSTGALRSNLNYSIPGGVRALDINQNDLIDRMYFSDTGGNVWRLDLSEAIGTSGAAPSVLTKMAELGGAGSDRRKFYNEPEVSSLRVDGRSVFTVSVGSGYRAHPLDTAIDDKFYILVDDAPFTTLSSTTGNGFTTITETNLAEITINGTSATSTGSLSDVNKRGWVIDFTQNGEKVLSPAFSFEGQVAFSTLVPEPTLSLTNVDQCEVPISQSNTYFFNILSGDLVEVINNDTSPGIANTIQPFFNEPDVLVPDGNDVTISTDGKTVDADGNVVDACRHIVDLRKGTNSAEISGYDSCKVEKVYWSDPVIQ